MNQLNNFSFDNIDELCKKAGKNYLNAPVAKQIRDSVVTLRNNLFDIYQDNLTSRYFCREKDKGETIRIAIKDKAVLIFKMNSYKIGETWEGSIKNPSSFNTFNRFVSSINNKNSDSTFISDVLEKTFRFILSATGSDYIYEIWHDEHEYDFMLQSNIHRHAISFYLQLT